MKERYKVKRQTWIRIGFWSLIWCLYIGFCHFLITFLLEVYPEVNPVLLIVPLLIATGIITFLIVAKKLK